MAIQFGPPIQIKNAQELKDATTFLNSYRSLYYGPGGRIVGENEIALVLVGYKNYLSALYGIGQTSPATGSIVTGSVSAANALNASGYI